MPLNLPNDLPTQFPQPQYLTLDNFKRGVITLIDKSRLPKNALEEAENIFLVEDGQPSLRPGTNWYGTAMPNSAEIDGFDYFDYDGVIHLVAVAGGTVYRSTNDGTTWSVCTGATLTAGYEVNMNQNRNYLYLTNGVDNMVRYDGTTTLQVYTALSTPAAPSVAQTGLGTTTIQYLYKVAAVNQVGYSIASPVGTGVTKFTFTRDSWSDTAYATISITGVTGATRYDIYISEDGVDYYYLDSAVPDTPGGSTTYRDNGTAVVNSATLAPTANTTQGPKVAELKNVGIRMFGVRDSVNEHRIWFSGGGANSGSFSSAYDGGYLDWDTGGKYTPVQVEDYRDGKGTPLATIWCKSADGQGCVLQMTLEVRTYGDIDVTIPSAYRLPGSRGTAAHGSVVNVLNDYMFYNSQAFYNLGSRAQFLNLLSTDEASANIRPTVKKISTAAEEKIASVYYDAKVYFSVPYGADDNNYTAVFDTERKAWLPKAFTIGFKKFLRYTDTNKLQHLLAVKPGDNKLTEISTSIQGDYGQPFSSSLLTGLYPVTRNRFEFQWTEEAEVEFSNPRGTVVVELLGIERTKGFKTTKTQSIVSTLVNTGWGTWAWDTKLWDDTSDAISTYSESSVKRYFNVNKELNAIQWRVTTTSLDAAYVLRTLQSWGTQTLAGKPRTWKL
jgi:hypothetical protein